jgi:protein-tyrosine phosphatase
MNAATLPSAERIIPLAGGCNFRDIGGYAASDGRTVRWGKVYRAGVLSYFSTDDHPSLARLGIRAICDLRREEERRRERFGSA